MNTLRRQYCLKVWGFVQRGHPEFWERGWALAAYEFKRWPSIKTMMFHKRHLLTLPTPNSSTDSRHFFNEVEYWRRLDGHLLVRISPNDDNATQYCDHRFDPIKPSYFISLIAFHARFANIRQGVCSCIWGSNLARGVPPPWVAILKISYSSTHSHVLSTWTESTFVVITVVFSFFSVLFVYGKPKLGALGWRRYNLQIETVNISLMPFGLFFQLFDTGLAQVLHGAPWVIRSLAARAPSIVACCNAASRLY